MDAPPVFPGLVHWRSTLPPPVAIETSGVALKAVGASGTVAPARVVKTAAGSDGAPAPKSRFIARIYIVYGVLAFNPSMIIGLAV